MPTDSDFWYAYNATRVLHAPRQTLQTFGATTIHYHVVSELAEEEGKVRIRAGKVHSERPVIITPNMGDGFLQGFDAEAREFMETLASKGRLMRIVSYGLQFRKDAARQEVVEGKVGETANRVVERVKTDNETFSTVIVGADELWEVSLLRFVIDFIEKSLPLNIQEIHEDAAEKRIREHGPSVDLQIERDFLRAERDPAFIQALGENLQRLGVFEKYEDRFYGLLRRRT